MVSQSDQTAEVIKVEAINVCNRCNLFIQYFSILLGWPVHRIRTTSRRNWCTFPLRYLCHPVKPIIWSFTEIVSRRPNRKPQFESNERFIPQRMNDSYIALRSKSQGGNYSNITLDSLFESGQLSIIEFKFCRSRPHDEWQTHCVSNCNPHLQCNYFASEKTYFITFKAKT